MKKAVRDILIAGIVVAAALALICLFACLTHTNLTGRPA